MTIDKLEILALKELAIICGALATKISEPAAGKQRILTRVLCDVINRAEIDNAAAEAGK